MAYLCFSSPLRNVSFSRPFCADEDDRAVVQYYRMALALSSTCRQTVYQQCSLQTRHRTSADSKSRPSMVLRNIYSVSTTRKTRIVMHQLKLKENKEACLNISIEKLELK